MEQFKSDMDFAALHKLKDEWSVRLEQTKIRTGKSLVSTMEISRYSVPEETEQSSSSL
eukprot:NODE_8416_length_410_cov_49.703601_g7542_i0.p1 GENE.NODE_8416_length_410_cov_49.703601_g7542_i0~~NODE_8416_length_410_cov_49.703601_g7542_i0.p1  ORF type:complete len:58 (-),score=9.82 NODE_8416_length_410_cov_49.703601_g7542_i0:91-264(-)